MGRDGAATVCQGVVGWGNGVRTGACVERWGGRVVVGDRVTFVHQGATRQDKADCPNAPFSRPSCGRVRT